MKVKVRTGGKDIIFDGEEVPIMIILSEGEKKYIEHSGVMCQKFVHAPKDSLENMEKWVNDLCN